ncbi:hypothetical protein AAG906_037011 [Vitis piasezkii]
MRKARTLLILGKRQRDKNPSCRTLCARLGPQSTGGQGPSSHNRRCTTTLWSPIWCSRIFSRTVTTWSPLWCDVHPHLPPIGSISKRLDDMLSTPFCSHIIHYEPPRGFLVPKFSTYDGSNDPFDHIMHYRQLMTLDIGSGCVQSIPRQPTRAGPLMVSPPTSQLC